MAKFNTNVHMEPHIHERFQDRDSEGYKTFGARGEVRFLVASAGHCRMTEKSRCSVISLSCPIERPKKVISDHLSLSARPLIQFF